MTDHPITPPPELVSRLQSQFGILDAIVLAYRAGADQELEACCELLDINGCPGRWIDMLRAARRPKPPSLKAGAIEVLDELDGLFELPAGHYNTILRALEQLDDSL